MDGVLSGTLSMAVVVIAALMWILKIQRTRHWTALDDGQQQLQDFARHHDATLEQVHTTHSTELKRLRN